MRCCSPTAFLQKRKGRPTAFGGKRLSPCDGEVPDERSLAPHVRELVRYVRHNESKLDFADRVMLGQYLERHGAPETASNVLHGHVAVDRDTPGLRCYVSSSIAAGLSVRSRANLGALPAAIARIPFYVQAAATTQATIARHPSGAQNHRH